MTIVERECTCDGHPPDCLLHGVAASNARESAYWSDPARSAEWADSLNGPKP